MTTPKLGDFCKLYCDTGSSSTPVWTEWGEIDGVDCGDLARSSVELNVRSLRCKPSLPAKINALSFSFKYYPGFNSTNYTQLISDFFDETKVRKWAMVDGDISTAGTQGLMMPAYVEGIPYHQTSGEAVSHDVTLKYGYLKSGNTVVEPEWMTISA
ncbi:MAG: hypothetical protein IJK97_00815 [Thermoguttaceae bacterium]|nr:hypothetical protein [Thermoguttaceae bacterium]MBR0190450.1 hypothetical protein [Thermoguttaceae bacterium]